MKEFGMLKDIKEEILAKELYDTINGKCKNGINEDLLKSAVLAILRIEAKGDKKLLALELHKRFSVFYFNKMSYQKPAENPQQYSHAPTLNPNSIRLAEKSKERRKQLAQEVSLTNTSNPTLTDLLMIVKKAQEKQTEAKRKKKAAEETKGCTFRPATFAKGLKSKKEDKHIWLRNLSRPSKKSLDKTTEQIEYEKSKDELTFTPRVPRFEENNKSVHRNKGIDTSVERLRKARYDKECIELARTLGITRSKAESLMAKRSKSKSALTKKTPVKKDKRMPMLEAEININEKTVEKCVIYEGETAVGVADKIAEKHNLGEEDKKTILEQLQKHFEK